MKFRLVEGAAEHVEGGVVYKAGDVIESALPLDELFVGKFVRLEEKAYVQNDPVEVVASPLGEDVTQDFPEAAKAGLRVFQRGRWYSLADSDAPDREIARAGSRAEMVTWVERFAE